MAARLSDWYFTNGDTPDGIKAQVDDIQAKAVADGHEVKNAGKASAAAC